MKKYCGWINASDFACEEYKKLYDELEKYQFDFVKNNKYYQNGWIYIENQRTFSSDVISNWSRQFEYPYVLTNIIDEPKNLKILDVGAGYSFFPFYLRDQGFNITCCDLLELGNLYNDTAIDFIKDDITASKIDSKFDIIYSLSVFEHIPNKKAAIENIHKLLSNNGKLILTMDCNLDLNTGDSTPNYGELCEIIKCLEEKFTSVNQYNLSRNEDLITTKMFSGPEKLWRLPWKNKIDSSYKTRLTKMLGLNQKNNFPAIGVFVGVWVKKI